MDIDRNFLEEMLIMEEDRERRTIEPFTVLPPAEETSSVELTGSELQLLDRLLFEASQTGRRPTGARLSAYEIMLLRRIRSKIGAAEPEKALAH